MLEVIGVNVSDDVKNYVMDEHLDWIKLEKHLDEDCVLPMNVFRQMIEKLQNQSKILSSNSFRFTTNFTTNR